MGVSIDIIKGELTKKPEELTSEKLAQAKGLAQMLTEFRKFLYLFFSIGTGIALVAVSSQYADGWVTTIILVFLILYSLFKFRDYIRGTI